MDIIDEAAAVIEADRTEAVRRVQAALIGAGAADCIDCGEDIDPARRAALPSAERCILCQTRHGEAARRERACGPMIVGDEL